MQSATLSTSAPPRQFSSDSEPRRLTTTDIAESVAAIRDTYDRDTSAAGICVADGMGLRLSVERGALVVTDGIGDHCRTRRFDKATHRLSRLVVMGTTGTFSIDALHWCSRLGIGVIVLAHDGTVQLTSTPRLTDDARLRRTQALAPFEPYGLDIARWLMSRKIMGQGKLVLQRFGDAVTAETIGDLALAVESAATIDELRQLEASAAALYFGAWSGRAECAPAFAARDRSRVPPHWSRYEGRRSVLASAASNRKAERPVNALLNYVYSLVEAEAILACLAVGLDPGLGIVHADAKGASRSRSTSWSRYGPRSTPSCSTSWNAGPSAKSSSSRPPTGTSACGRRSPMNSPRRCRSGPSRSARLPNTWPMSSARRWPAHTQPPLRSRPAAFAMHRPSCKLARSRRLVVRLLAGSSSAQRFSRPLCRCGPAPTAEEQSRTLAMFAAKRASPLTQLRRPRSGAGVAPPSRPASGRCRSGIRPIPARSTTRSCSGGTSCRGSRA